MLTSNFLKVTFFLFVLIFGFSFALFDIKALVFKNVLVLTPEAYGFLYFSYCDEPVTYKIGKVDDRFGVTEEAVLTDLKKGADIWNIAYKKPLLSYDPEASLTVSLIYDDRQRTLIEMHKKEAQVVESRDVLDAILIDVAQERDLLNSEIEALNAKVAYWNSRGGAPEGDYEELNNKRNNLQAQIELLNRRTATVNTQIASYNRELATYINYVDEYNNVLQKSPEEGLYNGVNNTIDIYFYDSQVNFVHTAAHEFGHALGLDHIESKDSVMHPVVNYALDLSNEDLALLAERCKARSLITELLLEARRSLAGSLR